MNAYFLKKLCRAVTDLPHTLRTTPRPKLIMTYLVKNEEEMLEESLLFHKMMGVDAFIVTDNNSTDRTPEILRKYHEKGWVLEIINEPCQNYPQKRLVDRMAWIAKTKYHADWIINADGDELWYTPLGNLKAEISHTHATALVCPMRNVYPEENLPWTAWPCTVRPILDPLPYDLSPYSVFDPQHNKVLHRADGYLQIAFGNHKATMFPPIYRSCGIVVFHYTISHRARFIEKIKQGGAALERNKSKHGGRHWRYFYEIYKQGKLSEEYDRVTGKKCRQRLESEGHIVQDNPVPSLLEKIRKQRQ